MSWTIGDATLATLVATIRGGVDMTPGPAGSGERSAARRRSATRPSERENDNAEGEPPGGERHPDGVPAQQALVGRRSKPRDKTACWGTAPKAVTARTSASSAAAAMP
jgi:hypothetical protein